MLNTIAVTDQERRAGRISAELLAVAIERIQQDGFVTLLNVAAVEHLDNIYAQMLEDMDRWNATAAQPLLGGNFTPSRKPELLYPDIVQNRIVADIVAGLMGREPSCGMYSSNLTLPGLGEQQLHVDMSPLQGDEDFDGTCHAVVVNFPAIDFTVENGATELWPGSHRIPREVGQFEVSQRLQDERRTIAPPIRAVIPRGGVLIRDIRLWHRGTLNQTASPRPMLALICNGGFKPGSDDITKIPELGPMPVQTEALFREAPALYYNPQFTAQPILAGPGHIPGTA